MAQIQNTQNTSAGNSKGQQELSLSTGENAKWYSQFGGQFNSFLEN